MKGTKEGRVQTVEALADSGASASFISWDLAKKVNMIVFEKGDAKLKDASHKYIDVSGRGKSWYRRTWDTTQNKSPGLKRLGKIFIICGCAGSERHWHLAHREFPKTLPERRREDAKQFNGMSKWR